MDFYERNKISIVGLSNERCSSPLLDNRSRDGLLRRAFREMRTMRRWRGSLLVTWIGVMTGHGSGYSYQICKELDWDPNMKITPPAELPDPPLRHNVL